VELEVKPIKGTTFSMQETGNPPRYLKNSAERQLFQELTSRGWEVSKRGWPDFVCFKGNNLALVEVKRNGRCHLKRQQQRLMKTLASFGVKCFLWSPDGGFQPISPML
jgi:hypothetical protein